MSVAPLPFGVALPSYGPLASPTNLVRLARRAEELGVDSVWVADHLVAPTSVATAYPFDRRADAQPGQMGVIEHFYEPLTTLAYLAAATGRVRLGVSVYIMPYRNPVVTAKMVATLDVLSGGRVIFGVGVGWLREEFVALGHDPRRRGRETDDYLEVCRRLWRDEVAEFAGGSYVLPAVRTGPKPLQRPWPPLWVGGNSAAALQRAARLGDGWHLIDLTPEELTPCAARLQRALDAAHRDRSQVTLSLRKGIHLEAGSSSSGRALYGPPDKLRADRDAYARAGLEYLVLTLRGGRTIESLEEALTVAAETLQG